MPKIEFQDIVNLYEEAARTDRRLPPAYVKQKTTAWVDYRQEKMYQHSYHKTELKIVPSPRQVERWWIASELLRIFIDECDMRKLIWARAKKIPFTKLGRIFGYSRHKIKQKWLEEVAFLRLCLQQAQTDPKKNKKIISIIDKIIIRKG